MTELLFVACVAVHMDAAPVCRQHSLLFVDVSVMTCMMGAQHQLALWARDHPGQEIRHWHCRIVKPGETES